jgi:ParB/RepB/Spo0J family partition protein
MKAVEREMRRLVREVTADYRNDKVAQEVEKSGAALAVLGIDELKPHPKNPRIGMREDVIEAIAASIREHGFHERHAITARKVKAGYQIISGHHRVEAAKRAGLDAVPAWVVEMDDDQAYMALAKDNSQGEMSLVELAIHAAGVKAKRGQEGDGVKAWAEAMGYSQEQRAHELRSVGHYVMQLTPVDRSKLREKFSHLLAAVEAFDGDELDAIVERIASGELETVADVKGEARKAKAKAKFIAAKADWDAGTAATESVWRVEHGDFRQVLNDIEDDSLDAIVTDPPYPDEFLPLWAELADFAMRKLRPGAPLIAYSGQFRLRQVLDMLCDRMTYQWTICLDLPGANSRFRGPNMIQGWKPIIVCTKGQWGAHDWFTDRVTSPKKDQELYEWQQNPEPVVELLARYVPSGGIVCDPFTGVGSFGAAVVSSGRRFVGAEMDENRFHQASLRIAEVASSVG